MPGTLHVNKIGAATGTEISVETSHSMTFATTQFKLTGGTAGQAITTDGSGNLTFADMTSDPTMGGDLSGTASNAQIVAGAVSTTEIATDAITANEIAAGAVGSSEIAADAVGSNEIAAGAVGASEIASTFDISSKTVTLPAASVTAHVTAYNDTNLRNDIATLALHSAIADNKAAYNLSNVFIDQFEDDTGLDGQTDVDRVGDPEYMSSITFTTEDYHINANGFASKSSGAADPVFSTTNNARTSFGASTGSSGFSLNNQAGKNSGVFTFEQTLVQVGNGPGPNMYGYGVMKNNAAMIAYTGNTYSAYPNGLGFNSSSSVGDKLKTVYDTDSPNVITVYKDTGSGYGSGNTSLGSQGVNFTDAITTLYFFSVCWSDSTNDWKWDVSGTRVSGTTSATGNFTCVNQTALSAVTSMGIIVLYKNNAGTATLNTDMTAEVSADGGLNYASATLVAGGTFSTGINIAAVSGVTVTSGTAPKYRISFANQANGSKETQVHGVALLY